MFVFPIHLETVSFSTVAMHVQHEPVMNCPRYLAWVEGREARPHQIAEEMLKWGSYRFIVHMKILGSPPSHIGKCIVYILHYDIYHLISY